MVGPIFNMSFLRYLAILKDAIMIHLLISRCFFYASNLDFTTLIIFIRAFTLKIISTSLYFRFCFKYSEIIACFRILKSSHFSSRVTILYGYLGVLSLGAVDWLDLSSINGVIFLMLLTDKNLFYSIWLTLCYLIDFNSLGHTSNSFRVDYLKACLEASYGIGQTSGT
jgi:hypothetical protein